MRIGRNSKGRFVKRRNPAPKGAEKTVALSSAMSRRFRHHRATGKGAARVLKLHGSVQRRRRIVNPGPKGLAKAHALLDAGSRRARVRRVGHGAHQYAFVGAAARRFRRNPGVLALGLAGLGHTNPSRRRRNPKRKARHMARRRRSAAQRAAFRKMISGLKRSKSKRRRRNPARRRGTHMAKRRRSSRGRRRAVVRMVNPRRARRSVRRRRGAPRRMRRVHHRRRRNPGGPGGGIKGALRSVFVTAVPALGAGFVANFIDAKFLSDKNIVIRVLAKVAEAAACGMLFRSKPVMAYASMGAVLGSIGGDFGTRVAGGVVVGATPVAKAAGVAALITEDPRTMGVLVEGMRGMGYSIDNNVSLGDPQALPAGSYQDVNLG